MNDFLKEENLATFYDFLCRQKGSYEITLTDHSKDMVDFIDCYLYITGLTIQYFSNKTGGKTEKPADEIKTVNTVPVSQWLKSGYTNLKPRKSRPLFVRDKDGHWDQVIPPSSPSPSKKVPSDNDKGEFSSTHQTEKREETSQKEPEKSFQDTRVIFSVSEITRRIKQKLTSGEFSNIWIMGELGTVTYSARGHIYFTIKDDQAVINAVMFSRNAGSLKFRLEHGLKIEMLGSLSLYEPRGSYQIMAQRITPFGQGELQLAFEQMKTKLYKEGLFDESAKKPLPRFPETVGVITSKTGAAVRDILKTTKRAFAGQRIIIYPAKVQGKDAAADIKKAIETACRHNQADVLIVGRGGGSAEDLWCFNEEITARAVFNASIPVISAVGHEIDYTMTDYSADYRCVTPTAAAEKVTENFALIQDNILNLNSRLIKVIKGIHKHISTTAETYTLSRMKQSLFFSLDKKSQHYDDLTHRLHQTMLYNFRETKNRLFSDLSRLKALSPFNVLERGYSVIFINKNGYQKAVTDVHELRQGDKVKLKLFKGETEAEIISKPSFE